MKCGYTGDFLRGESKERGSDETNAYKPLCRKKSKERDSWEGDKTQGWKTLVVWVSGLDIVTAKS